MLSIGSVIKSSAALPIHHPKSLVITSQTALIAWEIISMSILLLAIVYWIIKHVKQLESEMDR